MPWKILAKVRARSNLSKRCNLCIEEKYYFESPNGDAKQAQQTVFNLYAPKVQTIYSKQNANWLFSRTEKPLLYCWNQWDIFFLLLLYTWVRTNVRTNKKLRDFK